MAKLAVATETMLVGGKTVRPGQAYDPKLVAKASSKKGEEDKE